MASISAIVITRNEEANIADCLATLTWADEILVLDSNSTDRTVDISHAFTELVFQQPFTTFSEQRNAALALARGEWAFFLDADERVTPELAREIREVTAGDDRSQDTPVAGFWAPRKNYILGRWIRHAGWWPDYQMRLFLRAEGRYDTSVDPHEVVIIKGRAGYLLNPIVHYNYTSVKQVFSKQARYAEREALALGRAAGRGRPRWVLSQPAREFYFRYFKMEGYKEGGMGVFLSLVMAWYKFNVYLRLARYAPPSAHIRR